MKNLTYKLLKVFAKALVYAAFSAVGLTAAQGCVAGGDVHISLTGQPTADEVNTVSADKQ